MAARTTDINEFLNQARDNLPGASDASIKATLFNVCREFFKDSSCWTYNVDLVAVTDQYDYDIVVPEGQIIRLSGVVDGDDFPVRALMSDLGTINLQSPLTEDTDFTVTVILNTSLPTTKDDFPIVPDWLLPRYGDGILAGLVGRMMLQIGKTYSNKELATYHLKRFRNTVAEATVDKLHRNTTGAQAWQFPRSFRK